MLIELTSFRVTGMPAWLWDDNGNESQQLAYAEAEAAMVAALTRGHAVLGAMPKREQIMQLTRQARLVDNLPNPDGLVSGAGGGVSLTIRRSIDDWCVQIISCLS